MPAMTCLNTELIEENYSFIILFSKEYYMAGVILKNIFIMFVIRDCNMASMPSLTSLAA